MKVVNWNFKRILIKKEGEVIGRFVPETKPVDLEVEIEEV